MPFWLSYLVVRLLLVISCILNIWNSKMGGAFCGTLFNNFTLPNLRKKNDYDLFTAPQIQNEEFE